MSEELHEFPLSSRWTENSDGDGVLTFEWGGRVEYGVPVSSGGKEGRSNPEELLTAAVASCYCITLALLLERKRIPPPVIELKAVGEMVRLPNRMLKFTAIRLKPRLLLTEEADADRQRILLDMAHKAEQYCVISNTLRGNVEITVEPELALAG